jgi:hypothetical protein
MRKNASPRSVRGRCKTHFGRSIHALHALHSRSSRAPFTLPLRSPHAPRTHFQKPFALRGRSARDSRRSPPHARFHFHDAPHALHRVPRDASLRDVGDPPRIVSSFFSVSGGHRGTRPEDYDRNDEALERRQPDRRRVRAGGVPLGIPSASPGTSPLPSCASASGPPPRSRRSTGDGCTRFRRGKPPGPRATAATCWP